jgi:flagellar basal body rod protein FlgC
MAITPEQTRQALEEIAAKSDGILKPEAIVEAASRENHPLHDRFEWDNSRAAHAHRVDQARQLIRSVRVETITTKRTVSTVFYLRDPSALSAESGYVSLPRLQTDKEMAVAALTQELGRALAALSRARDLAAALGCEAAVDDMVTQLRVMSEQVPELRVA